MVSIADAALVLTQAVSPAPVPLVDYVVADLGDGQGPQIVQWSPRLGPQPTAAQLAAVTVQQVGTYYQAAAAKAANSLLSDASPHGTLFRALTAAAGLTVQMVQNQIAAASQTATPAPGP